MPLKTMFLAAFVSFAIAAVPQAWCTPTCPSSGVTILDDTYPALAYVVGTDFTKEFIDAVASAHPGSTRPFILVPSTISEFNTISSSLTAQERENTIRVSIKGVKRTYYDRWFQDIFESFFNPTTGAPVIARLSGDDDEGDDSVQAEVQQIAASIRKLIPSTSYIDSYVDWGKGSADHGMMAQTAGGDIEALPGGLCLHGSDQEWDMLSARYCGKHDNEVILDTSWLQVGHVDEIVSVIPTNATSETCAFAIGMPAPELAINLLSEKDWSEPYLSQRLASFSLTKEQIIDASEWAIKNTAANREIIAKKLKERLPECQVSFVSFPVLFRPAVTNEEKALPGKRVTAFTANLVNAVKDAATYIAEDPVLPAFRKSAEASLKVLGVNLRWIHADLSRDRGSVHCASQTIRTCRAEADRVK